MPNKLLIYLDTSIINFLFADDSPDYKDATFEFFDKYLNDYDVYISKVVLAEIDKTNNMNKKRKLKNAIKKYKLRIYNELNSEIQRIAEQYIKYKVIPEKKFEDALHIAFSTYYGFDILLSWNFKHLANINKQLSVNQINMTLGYFKPLLLTNPLEVIYEK